MEQLVARRAHNPKVVGSSPAPATEASQRNLRGFSFLPGSSSGSCPLVSGRRFESCSRYLKKMKSLKSKDLRLFCFIHFADCKSAVIYSCMEHPD